MLDTYIETLKNHDWFYEFSDDHGVYSRGRDARAALRKMQQELDSDYEIWDKYAPEQFRLGHIKKLIEDQAACQPQ